MLWIKLPSIFIAMIFGNKHTMLIFTTASKYPFTNRAFQLSSYELIKERGNNERDLKFKLLVLRQFMTLD